jgi:hypothetical protein
LLNRDLQVLNCSLSFCFILHNRSSQNSCFPFFCVFKLMIERFELYSKGIHFNSIFVQAITASRFSAMAASS